MKRLSRRLLVFLTLGCWIVSLVGSFLTGAVIGQGQLYHSFSTDKIRRLEPLVADYPELGIEFSSAAQVYLVGQPSSNVSLNQLKQRLVQEFGRPEADRMTYLFDRVQ